MAADNTIDDTLAEAGLDPVIKIKLDELSDPRIVGLQLVASSIETPEIHVLDDAGQPVSIKALLAERQYWREHQACELDELLRAWDQKRAPKAWLIERIGNAYIGLKDAIAGKFYETCEGCGRQIWPGEIEIPCTDVRCHADCSGTEGIKAGDQVEFDPEGIQVEEGEEPRGYVIAFAAKHLFTADEIQERVMRARDVLAKAGRI